MTSDVPGMLKQALVQARDYENRKEAAKAAEAYEKAAKLMREYASQAGDRDGELRRLGKARDYEKRAKGLRDGKIKLSADSDRDEAAVSPRRPPIPEEYLAMINPLRQKVNVTWADIGGLDDVKRQIKLTYGLALADKPDGIQVRGTRNVLLYGPPGTGKTLLAAATSNSLNAAFFNVKIGSLLSKWFGESPKLVSTLYDVARGEADEGGFAEIFIDEFDALSLSRDSDGPAGPERRVLSTLLAELDGLKEKGEDNYVLTIAATNAPWDLDPAALSRFQKRIYIPLPDAEARRQIIDIHLRGRGYQVDCSNETLVSRTEGFGGRDIDRLCNEAINLMVDGCNPEIPRLVDQGSEAIRGYRLKVRPIGRDHIEDAFRRVKVDRKRIEDMEKRYREFSESY